MAIACVLSRSARSNNRIARDELAILTRVRQSCATGLGLMPSRLARFLSRVAGASFDGLSAIALPAG
jgi:hypothetical protein